VTDDFEHPASMRTKQKTATKHMFDPINHTKMSALSSAMQIVANLFLAKRRSALVTSCCSSSNCEDLY
jgi:hypothetical protein